MNCKRYPSEAKNFSTTTIILRLWYIAKGDKIKSVEEINNDPDNAYEISLSDVKKRAVKGVAVLTSRTLLLNIISFIAQGLLWLFIEPGEFGVFILVSATINFLSYFADIGLGAALIQKKEKPKEEDFKTVFLVQEVLVITIVTIVFLISPMLTRTHNLTREAVMLLYALNISFLLASFKNIPSIMLERKLEFGKFVIPQVLENVVYNVTLVYFAWKGFGITSFTYAVLVRGVVGLVAIYILQPWKPGIALSKDSLKGLLKFGIPYQLNNFLATIKDDGLTIVLGGILGTYGLGILATAQKLSQYPLRFFMDNVTKVTFPAFSRMQDDKIDLARSLNRSIFFICALVFPSLVGLLILFPVLITVIPKYQKWAPAFIPLIFLTLSASIAAFTTQLTNLLTSVGKIKITLKLMIMWTSLSWIFLPLLSRKWGINGAALGYAIVGISSFVVLYITKKILDWSIFNSIIKPALASLFMGVVFFAVRNNFGSSVFSLIILVLIGGIIYTSTLYLLVGRPLIDDVKRSVKSIIK